MVIWAVLRYPALRLVAPLSAYPAKWGPIVLLLLLLLLLGKVLGRHLGLVVPVALQKRVDVVLVLLRRRGQMRAGALRVPLLLLLLLLRGLETAVVLQLLLCKAGVTLPDRLASPYAVLAGLLRGVFVLVPRKPGRVRKAAAERLLGLVDGGGRRLRR